MRHRVVYVTLGVVLTAVFVSAEDRYTPAHQPDATNSVIQHAEQNPGQLVAQTMHNELNADLNDHSLWTYIEDKVDGRKHTVKKVVETPKGDASLMIAENGYPLPPDELKRQKAHLDQMVRDPQAFAREQADEHQDEQKARELMKMIPTAFLYKYEGHKDGIIHLSFRPNPKFNPPTREAKVFHAMAGIMWIQAREKRLMKLAGHLIEDVDFGMGILGKLTKGGTFELDRAEFAPTHWKTTLTDVHLSGRALFFKSISEQQHEVDRDYKQIPKLNTLQAAKLLEGQLTLAQASHSAH